MRGTKLSYFDAWKNLGGLPRDLWILFIATLINRLGTMAFPFLALYLNESLKFSPRISGIMLSIYGGAALIAGPTAGFLSDRFGPLTVMTLSLFSSGIVLFTYPMARTLLSVSLMTILFSFTNETFRPANLAAISDLVPSDQRKAAFALNRLATNLGMSIGPALGSILAQVSFPALFIVDGMTTFISGFFLFFAFFHFRTDRTKLRRRPHPTTEGVDSSEKRYFIAPVLSDHRFLYFLISIIPVVIVFFQYEAALPIYLVKNLELPISTFGLLFTINTITITLLEIPLNSITSHWSFRKTLSVGSVFFSVGFGTMAFARDIWISILSVIIWTFGEMILFPGMSAYVTEIAPAHRRGEYLGLYSMSFSLSCMIGPWLGTEILSHFGGYTLWVSCFWFALISTLALSRISATPSIELIERTSG
jgi:MFS family permease